MKYSCCTTLENLPLLEAAGYDRIILPCTQVAGWSEAEFEKALAAISGSSLECRGLNSFCTPELRLCGPGYDAEKVESVVADTYRMDGIYYIKTWLNEGELKVGDDIMYVLIGGDIRPHVVDALQYLVGRIKNECVTETELH